MAHAVMHDAALHRARLQDALTNIAGTLSNVDDIYENDARTRWVIEWDDLASIGTEIRIAKKEDHAKFDTSIFGPALKQTTKDGQATEIKQVLLAKEKDFTDALINIDRDNFLSSPYDSIIHDVSLLRSVAAGIYAVNRGLFVGMTPDVAMQNVHYYRFMVRHLRSQLYITDLITENVERLSERTFNLEVVKEKYEATIFTLRRQLDDYHKAHGAVGKNADGQMVANDANGRNALHGMIAAAASAANTLDAVNNGGAAAAILAGMNAEDTTGAYCVVQIEELGNLRSRQRQIMDKAIEHCKQVMLTTANGFDAKRTNFHEENEKRDSHNLPSCYMFKITDMHNAIAFGMELHNELNGSDWPKQLIDMKRFGGDVNWKGLRVRIGVHYGEAALVESPDGTIVQHYEGVVVDKAMRLASLAACGECLVSKAAWEAYQAVLKEGKVPPSKRYQNLRSMVTDRVESGRKRGFRKDEYYMRVWPQCLSYRKDGKPADVDVEFGLISFFGLEIGATVEEESDVPTAEDLLQAKDTEITLLQQELDSLRLAILKRDSDIEEIRTHMFSHIGQLNSRMDAKSFYHDNLTRSLECQLMKAHDTMSRCSHITAGSALGGVRDAQSAKQRRESALQSRRRSSRLFEPAAGEAAQPSFTEDGESAQPSTGFGGYVAGDDDAGATLADFDRQRMDEFEAWKNGGEKSDGGLRRTRSNASDGGKGGGRHKNHKLWRELNQLITGATVTSKAPPPKPRSRSLRPDSGAHDGVTLGATANGKDPTVVQKIHALVRVYGRLLKRFSQVKNEADVDDQALSEDQFIQLFLRLTNSDPVGSARETFHLCMQTAIDSEDIEAANATDDSRLMRSVIGHFVKIFLLFRTFKKRAIVDANLFDEEGNLRENAEKIAEKAKKNAKGGGAKRASGAVGAAAGVAKSAPAGSSLSKSMIGPKGGVGGGSSATAHLSGGAFSQMGGRFDTPAAPPPSSSSGAQRPPPSVTSPNLGGAAPTVSQKQLEALERQNAALVRDVGQRNERLEEAKAKSARDEETIRLLRDELRKIRTDADQRVKAAVVAAQASQKDPLLPRDPLIPPPQAHQQNSRPFGGSTLSPSSHNNNSGNGAAGGGGHGAAPTASGGGGASSSSLSLSAPNAANGMNGSRRGSMPRRGGGPGGSTKDGRSKSPVSPLSASGDSNGFPPNASGEASMLSNSNLHANSSTKRSARQQQQQSGAAAAAMSSSQLSHNGGPSDEGQLVAARAAHSGEDGEGSIIEGDEQHQPLTARSGMSPNGTTHDGSVMFTHRSGTAADLRSAGDRPPTSHYGAAHNGNGDGDLGEASILVNGQLVVPYAPGRANGAVITQVGACYQRVGPPAHYLELLLDCFLLNTYPQEAGCGVLPAFASAYPEAVGAVGNAPSAVGGGAPRSGGGAQSSMGIGSIVSAPVQLMFNDQYRMESSTRGGGSEAEAGGGHTPHSTRDGIGSRVATSPLRGHESPRSALGSGAGTARWSSAATANNRPSTSPSTQHGGGGGAYHGESRGMHLAGGDGGSAVRTGSGIPRAPSPNGPHSGRGAGGAGRFDEHPSEHASLGITAPAILSGGEGEAPQWSSVDDGRGAAPATGSGRAPHNSPASPHGSQHYMEVSRAVGSVRGLAENGLAAPDPSAEGTVAANGVPRGASSSYMAALGLAHASRVDSAVGGPRREERGELVVTAAGAGQNVSSAMAVAGNGARRAEQTTPLLPLQPVGLRGQTSAMQQQLLREQQQHALMLIQQQNAIAASGGEGMIIGKGLKSPSSSNNLARLSVSQPAPAPTMRRLPNNLYTYNNSGDFANEQVLGLGIGPMPTMPLVKGEASAAQGNTSLSNVTLSPVPAHAHTALVLHNSPSFQTVRPSVQDLSLQSRASEPNVAQQQQHAHAMTALRQRVHTVPMMEEPQQLTFGKGELQFAMTRAENQVVLAKAAEERRAYYDQQQRLQEQLIELRALQQKSQGLLGGKPKGIPHSIHQNDVALHSEAVGGKEPCLMEITRITPKPKNRGGSVSGGLPTLANTTSPQKAPSPARTRQGTPQLSVVSPALAAKRKPSAAVEGQGGSPLKDP